jgi:chromate transporter
MGSISEYAVAARRTPRARALTIGFVIAGGYVMAHIGDVGWQSLAITGAAAALMLRTRISPLWVLLAGGILGGLGAL